MLRVAAFHGAISKSESSWLPACVFMAGRDFGNPMFWHERFVPGGSGLSWDSGSSVYVPRKQAGNLSSAGLCAGNWPEWNPGKTKLICQCLDSKGVIMENPGAACAVPGFCSGGI